MSFLSAFLYDKCMISAEEACLKEWRQGLLKQVHGHVLEIGAGTGANIEFYPESVIRLVLSEPDESMRRLLEVKIGNSALKDVTVSSASAENIEANEESFDFVVASFVCCSVTNLEAVLNQIHRVLKPGGSLVFLEHVAADKGSKRRRWQNRMNPFWRKLAGNCHLNREIEKSMVSAGFEISEIKRESMRKAMPLVRPTIRGVAVKG
ncbi:MAG: class I SAM-dependent methyltransferase [Desulfobacteraceae bacterium]|nr:class I SAM-dependent methyltransferase [Desulfobacteraceae bacterium]MBC2757504.1 class I SAM-dependent methyltransferase [Desulfobacteraceae bacterium]